MSHVVAVKAFVTDLDILAVVADTLGFEFVRDATTHAWYGRYVGDFDGATAAASNGHKPEHFGTCLHKLRRKDHERGDYEIGVVARVDGGTGFELVYDSWGQSGKRIEQLAGKNLTALKQELSLATAARQLMKQGYRVVRSINHANGLPMIAGMR